jgi:hypothetical protein
MRFSTASAHALEVINRCYDTPHPPSSVQGRIFGAQLAPQASKLTRGDARRGCGPVRGEHAIAHVKRRLPSVTMRAIIRSLVRELLGSRGCHEDALTELWLPYLQPSCTRVLSTSCRPVTTIHHRAPAMTTEAVSREAQAP